MLQHCSATTLTLSSLLSLYHHPINIPSFFKGFASFLFQQAESTVGKVTLSLYIHVHADVQMSICIHDAQAVVTQCNHRVT